MAEASHASSHWQLSSMSILRAGMLSVPPEGQHWPRVGAATRLQPPASLACAVQGVGLEQAGHVLGSEGAVKEQQVRNRAVEEPAGCARGADGRGSWSEEPRLVVC